jgi:periplasmic divalent cation tolerance protein
VTVLNKEEAVKISKHLLEKKLIACTNFFPIESMYFWKEELKQDKEFVLIIKSKDSKKVVEEIKKIHSYDIPCIGTIPIQFNKEYQEWIDNQY